MIDLSEIAARRAEDQLSEMTSMRGDEPDHWAVPDRKKRPPMRWCACGEALTPRNRVGICLPCQRRAWKAAHPERKR